MIQYRTPKFIGLISATALLATTLVAAAPASAAPDPAPTAAAAKKDIRTLNRTARKMVWCIERKAADGTKKAKECKTREAWVREGNDPFGEY